MTHVALDRRFVAWREKEDNAIKACHAGVKFQCDVEKKFNPVGIRAGLLAGW